MRRLLLILVLAAALILYYTLGLHRYLAWDEIHAHLDDLHQHVHDNLPLTLTIYFLIYMAVTALSLPVATILSLLGGALFGRWLGTGVVLLAATLGATLAFLSSRYLLRAFVERRFGARLAPLNQGLEREGAYYLFFLRLLPIFPFFIVNLAMGLTRLSTLTFFWVSLLGMLPGTFLYVNAGTALASIDSPAGILSPTVLVSFALLGLFPIALRKIVSRAKKPSNIQANRERARPEGPDAS